MSLLNTPTQESQASQSSAQTSSTLLKDQSIANASIWDKAVGITSGMQLGTSINAIDRSLSMLFNQEEDKAFIKSNIGSELAKDNLWTLVKDLGGDVTLYEKLADAKNKDQFKKEVEYFAIQKRLQENVSSYLTDGSARASQMFGALISPENFAGAGLFTLGAKLQKAGSLMEKVTSAKTVIGLDTLAIGGSTYARLKADPDNYESTDILLDMGLNALFSIPAYKSMQRERLARIAQDRGMFDGKKIDEEYLSTMKFYAKDDIAEPSAKSAKTSTPKQNNNIEPKIEHYKEFKLDTSEGIIKDLKGNHLTSSDIESKLFRLNNMTERELKNIGIGKRDINKIKSDLELAHSALKKREDSIFGANKTFDREVAINASASFSKKISELSKKITKIEAQDLDEIKKSIKGLEDLNIKVNKDGSVDLSEIQKQANITLSKSKKGNHYNVYTGKNRQRKKIGKVPYIAGAILIGSSTANASDGDGVNVLGGLQTLVLFAGGVLLSTRALRFMETNNLNHIDLLQKFNESIADGVRSLKTKPWKENVELIVDKLRFGLFETYASLKKLASSASDMEVIDKLVQNQLKGRRNAFEIKDNIVRKFSANFEKENTKAFHQFIAALGKNKFEVGAENLFIVDNIGARFENYVSDYISFNRLPDGLSDEAIKSIKQAGDYTKKAYKELFDEMESAGIKIKSLGENYVPRLLNPSFIDKLNAIEVGSKSWNTIVNEFSEALMRANSKLDMNEATSKAEALLKNYRGDKTVIYDNSSILSDIEKALKNSGASDEAIAKALKDLGIQTSRAKSRIDLDLKGFKDIDIEIDGVKQRLGLSDIYDRDNASLFNRYINNISGHIAAYRMFGSTGKLDSAIEKMPTKLRTKVENIRKLLLNEPILDPFDETTRFVNMAKNITSALLLVGVTISMIPEVLRTTLRASTNKNAFMQTIREFGSIIRKNPDSELSRQINSMTGTSSSTQMLKNGMFRGLNDMANFEHLMSANHLSAKLRDISLLAFGMTRLNDFMARIHNVANAEVFAKFINGDKKIISALEAEKYGITPDIVNKFKGKIEILPSGELKAIDMSKWTKDMKDDFAYIMERMLNRYIQMSNIGGSPLMFKTSSIGQFVGTLMNFPMQAYSNHGLYDLKGMMNMDMKGYTSTALWLAGGMLSAQVRANLKGKDIDDETMLTYGIMSMPLTGGGISIANATGGDLAIFSVMQNTQNALKIISDEAFE